MASLTPPKVTRLPLPNGGVVTVVEYVSVPGAVDYADVAVTYRNADGELHRLDGPARMIHNYGDIAFAWHRNDEGLRLGDAPNYVSMEATHGGHGRDPDRCAAPTRLEWRSAPHAQRCSGPSLVTCDGTIAWESQGAHNRAFGARVSPPLPLPRS